MRVSLQMASQSVELVLPSSPMCPTYRHTDKQTNYSTCDICCNRPNNALVYLSHQSSYHNFSVSNIKTWTRWKQQYRCVVVSSSGPWFIIGFSSGLQLFTISTGWGTNLLAYSENVHGIFPWLTPRGLWGHLCRLHNKEQPVTDNCYLVFCTLHFR